MHSPSHSELSVNSVIGAGKLLISGVVWKANKGWGAGAAMESAGLRPTQFQAHLTQVQITGLQFISVDSQPRIFKQI